MFENVKQEIDDKIKTNGNNEITATRLNGVLQDMMDSAAEEIENVAQSVGDQVEANPAGDATQTLNKIKIDNTIYTAPQGPVGPNGITPTINPSNKHWMIGETDTGIVAEGQDGTNGQDGQPGAPGPANTLSIGTVTDGEQAAASITGTAPSQTLNLVLPRGAKGDPGTDGQDGQPGAPGQNAVNPFKGIFLSSTDLEQIEATPGDFAYVLNGTPQSADIYIYDETAISTNYWADSLNDVDLSNIDYNGGVTQAAKNLIISLFRKAVYDSDDADADIDALEEEFEETRTLQSITAVFTQGGATIYDTDSLDVLKEYLVVTANYDNGTTEILNSSAYTLSGTLEAGQSTIYAVYNNVSDDFTVNVTHRLEVISFSASELLNHYGLSNDYNQNNGLYTASNTKRGCYPYFDKLATGGKTYQVHVVSNKQNTGVGFTFYAQSALDKVAQQESILAGNNDDKFDPGWVTLDSDGYGTIVIPAYVGSQDNVIRCVRYAIRVGDGTTDTPNDIVVTIELTEQVNS